VLAGVLLVAVACEDGAGRPDQLAAEDGDGPQQGPIATIQGGVALPPVDVARVLVGEGLAFGSPLPREQAAADALVGTEVIAALARRVHTLGDGRHLADLLVLTLDGAQLFDESVLAAYERGIVGSLGGSEPDELPVAGRSVLRSADPAGRTTLGFREGNQLLVVRAANEGDASITTMLVVEAIGRGDVGVVEPATPMVPLPPEAAFVAVPGVTFTPFLPPELEPSPEPPALAGASAVQGRYGVVAGERRTIVWSFAVDIAAYPTAEALAPALQALVTERAGGTPPQAVEVGGRVVLSSSAAVGSRSAQAFRHQNLVVIVEGDQPSQLDAVTTAWVAALGPT
jgi:hypothetical protein